jgi:outer membrane protein assembly factor BamD (BamD/ComL family)
VLEARAALRAGDAARCLTLLEQARARFPRGALGQEREALTVEALARAGQSAAAKRRAAAFLRAHPQSPYVADLRRLAED